MRDYPDKYRNIKVVTYARVSSVEQAEEGRSLEAQVELMESHAQRYSLQIVKRFKDEESAGKAGRTQFTEMISFIRNQPNVNHIVVEKTDRLYRNLIDYGTIDNLDVVVHLVKEDELLSKDSNSHSKLSHGLKALLAQNYLHNLSEEVKKGLNQKAKSGEWPSRPPIGYVRNREDHKIYPDPERAPLVRKLFEEYSTGNYSLRSMAKLASKIGLRSTKGNAVNKAGIHRILQYEIYTGQFTFNGYRYEDAVHDAIVTTELFAKVNQLLKRPSTIKTTRRNYAFRGLVKCGYCGCSLTPDLKKGKYLYYRCTEYSGRCSNWISEPHLSDLLGQKVRDVQITTEAAVGLKLSLMEGYADAKKFSEKAIATLQARHKLIKARIDQAYMDKLDGTISQDYWRERANEWNAELMQIQSQIGDHKNTNHNFLKRGSQVIDLAEQSYTLYQARNNNERRLLIDSLLSQLSYADGTLCVTYRKPFNLLVKGPKTTIKRG